MSIEKIDQFLAGQSFQRFSLDALIHDGVVRNLEILSGASRHIPNDLEAKASHIAWRDLPTLMAAVLSLLDDPGVPLTRRRWMRITAVPSFSDEFSKQSAVYAQFRPTYPEALYQFLSGIAPGHDAAWDAGTGNGQCAVALARYFARVHATDASAEQIRHATPLPNIRYAAKPAEKSGLANQSIDLITAAQAAHWFDFARFVPEVHRILKPRGVIAVWGYSFHTSPDGALNAIMREFGEVTLRDYWPPQNRLLWNGYADLPFSFESIPHPHFGLTVEWNFEELCGYYTSWSATQKFIAANHYHPLRDILERLRAAWGPGERKQLNFDIAMKAGRVP
jgi:SAM-dependent methyltransferase